MRLRFDALAPRCGLTFDMRMVEGSDIRGHRMYGPTRQYVHGSKLVTLLRSSGLPRRLRRRPHPWSLERYPFALIARVSAIDDVVLLRSAAGGSCRRTTRSARRVRGPRSCAAPSPA